MAAPLFFFRACAPPLTLRVSVFSLRVRSTQRQTCGIVRRYSADGEDAVGVLFRQARAPTGLLH